MSKRISLESQKSFAYSVFNLRIKFLNIFKRALCINKSITHEPNISLWLDTLPALYSALASRMLVRYSGQVAARRSSINSSRSCFFIFLTASIISCGSTSIFKAVGIDGSFLVASTEPQQPYIAGIYRMGRIKPINLLMGSCS